MGGNKQLLLLTLFLVLANCRVARHGDHAFGTIAAASVVRGCREGIMGIDAFAQSLGYLPKGAPVPPSGPSHRRNWEVHAEEAEPVLAEVGGGGEGGDMAQHAAGKKLLNVDDD